MPRYCEVALPVPLRTTFTYAVPESLDGVVMPGCRVAVPFRNRALVGVVLELHDNPPAIPPKKSRADGSRKSKTPVTAQSIKEVAHVLDPLPSLSSKLIELGRWVGSYYLAPPGDVFRAMLPPLTELRAQRVLHLTDAGRTHLARIGALPSRNEMEITEQALLELIAIEEKPLAMARLAQLPGGEAAAARLLRRGHLAAEEISRERKARTQRIVSWNENADLTASNGHKPSAAEARLRQTLVDESGPLPLKLVLERAKVSRAVVDRLIRQGKLKAWEEPLVAEEDLWDVDFEAPANVLNPDQEHAAAVIARWLDRREPQPREGSVAQNVPQSEFAVGLLHGVTGSGKTEVYLCGVAEALKRGRSAIILVPEIALTLWMGRLCRARFGETVAVLHSALPDAERAREWWRVRRGEARVVVGTRSAVFAPAENLGLIIVDEEHEASYKQEESPRYHGRDTAILRAKLEGAAVLLGSATPSMESYQHARAGKYELLRLNARVAGREMARVSIVDMREEFRSSHRATAFSTPLREAMALRLASATQTLVLINRRGYSWFALCRSCGASVQCENCSIALTYHKQRQRLICHYCGYTHPVVTTCPKCSSEYVYFFGDGSERLEETLREMFPDARVARLDRDTARDKRSYQKILGAFASGKLDILVGTQMVAKGHDFQRVTLVGVVNADLRLSLPDFRAAERTFQLVTQVAGRAGRGELPGEVIVETFYPEHYAIQHAAKQDFEGFFEREAHFRRLMHYPPFAALANVLVRDRRIENAVRWSRQLEEYFRPLESRGVRTLGPAAAPVARLKREFRFQFVLKSPKRAALNHALVGALEFCAKKQIPESAIILDVDPLSMF
jgi:primosomal protein N' (replication factor Y)